MNALERLESSNENELNAMTPAQREKLYDDAMGFIEPEWLEYGQGTI